MIKQVLSTAACIFITLSIQAQTINDMNTPNSLTLKSEFPQGEPNVRFSQYFQGKSYLEPLRPKNLSEEEATVQSYSNVTFEPGCRNN